MAQSMVARMLLPTSFMRFSLVAASTLALVSFLLPVTGWAQEVVEGECSGMEVRRDYRENFATDHDLEDRINLNDCEGNEQWRFYLDFTVPSADRDGGQLYLYAGDNC